jgi:hypothetical protein
MPNPLLLDIVTFLTSKGVIEGDGIDTYRDFVPEMPDNLVAVTEYKGSPVVHFEPTVHRSIQIVVRNKSADVARNKALEIYKQFLSDNSIVVFTEERWGQVHLRQSPFRMKTDASDRVYYGFNMGITTTIE